MFFCLVGVCVSVGLVALGIGIYLLVQAADPDKAARLPFTSQGGARVIGIVALVLGILIGCFPIAAVAALAVWGR
jgi:hypothetical protein